MSGARATRPARLPIAGEASGTGHVRDDRLFVVGFFDLVLRGRRDVVDLLLLGRRDVVEFDRRIVLEIVHVVDAAAGAFLDRTARLVILLAPLLAAKALRGGRRAEVGTAIASAGTRRRTARTARTRPETARARAAETATRSPGARRAKATAPTGTRRTAEAARTRAAETARPGTGWPVFPGPGLADGEAPPLEGLRVEFPDDFFSDGAFGELDERKAARTAGLAIDRHDYVRRLCDCGEV